MHSSLDDISISIVTVCKNSQETLGATIASVIAQKDMGLEYIIIDGCSTDGTKVIIDSFADNIDVFISEPDNGIADAFNKGIRHSSGDIIGIINSDDALLPGCLASVATFFHENPHTEVLHGDVLFYDRGKFVKRISPPQHWWLPWRMSTLNIHAATFVRREVYERHGLFDTSYRYAMDDDLFLKWVKQGVKISYIPETLARVAAGGVSGRFAFSVFWEKRKALLRNGFPWLPSTIQYASRIIGQIVIMAQQAARRVQR